MTSNWLIKFVAIVVILQIAVLALMNQKVNRINSVLNEQAAAVQGLSAVTSDPVPDPVHIDARKQASLDERALRRIIREELAAHSTSPTATAVNPSGGTTTPGPELARTLDPVENAERLQIIEDELDYYIAIGEISKPEMAELQREIAGLDPKSRELMVKKMMAAFSSGKLRRPYNN